MVVINGLKGPQHHLYGEGALDNSKTTKGIRDIGADDEPQQKSDNDSRDNHVYIVANHAATQQPVTSLACRLSIRQTLGRQANADKPQRCMGYRGADLGISRKLQSFPVNLRVERVLGSEAEVVFLGILGVGLAQQDADERNDDRGI